MLLHTSVAEGSGAVSDQTAPAESVDTGENHGVVQQPQADSALIVLQHLCGLLGSTPPLHPTPVLLYTSASAW